MPGSGRAWLRSCSLRWRRSRPPPRELGVVGGEPSARAQAVGAGAQPARRRTGRGVPRRGQGPRRVAGVQARGECALATEVGRLDAALAENQATLQTAERARVRAVEAERVTATRLHRGSGRGGRRPRPRPGGGGTGLHRTGASSTSQPGSFEDADTGADLAIGFTYAELVGDVQRARVDRLRRDEAAVADLEGDAAAARDRTAAAKSALANRQAPLERDRAARGAALTKAAQEVTLQRALVVKVQAAEATYRSRIGALQAESASIAALLRASTVQTTLAPAVPPPTARPDPGQPRAAPASRGPLSPRPPHARPPQRRRHGHRPPRPARWPPHVRLQRRDRRRPRRPSPRASPSPTGPVGSTPPQRPTLSFPLPGWPIVSGYGPRVHADPGHSALA